jgi:hypothetical protein
LSALADLLLPLADLFLLVGQVTLFETLEQKSYYGWKYHLYFEAPTAAQEAAMGKINGTRAFLGGLFAGIVMLILGFASFALYLEKVWDPALKALGREVPTSAGIYVWAILSSLVMGILLVWLYAAIRPRYGAGAKTAVCAGLTVWVFSSLFPNASFGFMGVFPADVLVIDSLTSLVIYVVATLLGAWVYKEESR